MQSWKRLFYFLLLNVVVSGLTTWLVVSLMSRDFSQSPPVQPFYNGGDPSSQNGGQPSDPGESPADELSGADIQFTIGQIEIDSVIGAGDIENERVLIRHVGDQAVSLAGWHLEDEDGHSYTLPALTMFTGGAVTVYSREGTNTVVELYWGLNGPVWTEGEKALLIDPNGDVQAVYTVP
ncbi:MAG: lamin tail domain-containing protein [Anaerolineales bacterium]|jgi:hypothetical protein